MQASSVYAYKLTCHCGASHDVAAICVGTAVAYAIADGWTPVTGELAVCSPDCAQAMGYPVNVVKLKPCPTAA